MNSLRGSFSHPSLAHIMITARRVPFDPIAAKCSAFFNRFTPDIYGDVSPPSNPGGNTDFLLRRLFVSLEFMCTTVGNPLTQFPFSFVRMQ